MPVPDAVVVSTARTAIGTAFRGTLVDVDAFELGTRAVAEAVRRAAVDPALVDDVVLAEALYGGGDIARYAAIEAGLEHVAGARPEPSCAGGAAATGWPPCAPEAACPPPSCWTCLRRELFSQTDSNRQQRGVNVQTSICAQLGSLAQRAGHPRPGRRRLRRR
jgi:Thiolase, N-terminal domain